jgi:hypothetical protein
MEPHRNPTQLIREIIRHTKHLPTVHALIKTNPPTPTYGSQAPTGSHTTNTNPTTPTERAALNPTAQDQAITSITSDLQIIHAAHQRITLNSRRLEYATKHTPAPDHGPQTCLACNQPATPPRSAKGHGPLCTNCAQSWRTTTTTWTNWLTTRTARTGRPA